MTLQQPRRDLRSEIFCHNCGAPVVFSNDHISPITKRKIPLDPYFNKEPHQKHCMYFNSAPTKTDTELMLFDFLPLVPNRRQKHIIGAVGKAR